MLGAVLAVLADDGLPGAGLGVWERRSDTILLVGQHGLNQAETDARSWAPGEGPVGRVVALGEWAADDTLLGVPVRSDGTTLGVVFSDRPADAERGLARLRVVAGLLVPLVSRELRRRQQAAADAAALRQPSEIIGRSKHMRTLYKSIQQVSDSSTTVLIRGESGTGKELVARALHVGSSRAQERLVTVNMAALPDTLMESELFGHVRGAFTGAQQSRQGRFEAANRGTLFLDEIGDLAPAAQVSLLRVLQEGEITRLGEHRPRPVDVRIVAATSRDLEAMVESGEFRADLYYRLNVFPIRVPALRERRTDVLLLADHFVEHFNQRHGAKVRRISSSAIDLLMAYHWPGNVRELENCIERAVLVAQTGVIFANHLPPSLQTGLSSGTAVVGTLDGRLGAMEREIVRDALKEARGNMASAARTLGISERIMGLRVKKYGIDWRQYRS